MPVAGPVDLLDPGPQPGDRFRAVGGRELPPRRCWPGAVTVGVRVGLAGCGEPGERGSVLLDDAAEGGGLVGELGQPSADRGVMLGLAGVEPGELLGVGGELVHDGGDRVVAGHRQLQGKGAVAAEPFGGHVVGEAGLWLPVGHGKLGDGVPWGLAEAAGAAVGGVLPGAGQPGDDRGAAAADDQGEPGGQLADHVRGGDVVAGGVVLAADLPRRLPAQRARRLQRGDIGDAGQEHLHRGGVEHDLASVITPAVGELGLAVHDGDDLDAFAAGVRQPERQRDRADLRYLVQAHQQRRVQPPGRRGLAELGCDPVDLGGHRGEQRGDGGLFGDGLGDQVHGAGAVEEGGDVEPVAGAGQHAGGQGGIGHEGQGPGT